MDLAKPPDPDPAPDDTARARADAELQAAVGRAGDFESAFVGFLHEQGH